MGIQRVAVVGGGQMGGGVAELTAKAGLPTVIKEVSAEAAEHSETGIRRSLDRALDRGKLDEAAPAAAKAHRALRPPATWLLPIWWAKRWSSRST